ncbi:MAG: cyclopropane fatty acyl phospholipid synthase [Spirochaetes bacterium]|nr:cyclopropane fatty acyl phospholipid synthase [Spirochaetota bacterium]
MSLSRRVVEYLFAKAGITVGGGRDHDIEVHDGRFYRRLLLRGSLGLGESFMDGWWDSPRLDEFTRRLVLLDSSPGTNPHNLVHAVKARLLNRQSRRLSGDVAALHYNLDNDLYRHMLGPSMAYTCAYWPGSHGLDDAQFGKYDLVCRKIGLRGGERILDLGCGFGGFAKYAAKRYGCSVVCVNLSEEQLQYARELCRGLPVEFYLCDYRDVGAYNPDRSLFHKIVAIGLCEHVGPKNYRRWLTIVRDQLAPEGLFLLHTIGINITKRYCDPWYDRYIFPNGTLPSIGLLGASMEGLFVMEDWHNLGADYYRTLHAWWDNFERYWRGRFGESGDAMTPTQRRFYRMWKYYIIGGSGAFLARHIQLWQIVLSRGSLPAPYVSVR